MVSRAALPLLAIWASAACVGLDNDPEEVVLWEAQLVAEVPDLTGQAAAVSGAAGTDLGIGLNGAPPGAAYAWSARVGTCTTPGEDIGLPEDYPVLEVTDLGAAAAETHLASRFRRDGTYQVEVHQNRSDTTKVACGNLVAR